MPTKRRMNPHLSTDVFLGRVGLTAAIRLCGARLEEAFASRWRSSPATAGLCRSLGHRRHYRLGIRCSGRPCFDAPTEAIGRTGSKKGLEHGQGGAATVQ